MGACQVVGPNRRTVKQLSRDLRGACSANHAHLRRSFWHFDIADGSSARWSHVAGVLQFAAQTAAYWFSHRIASPADARVRPEKGHSSAREKRKSMRMYRLRIVVVSCAIAPYRFDVVAKCMQLVSAEVERFDLGLCPFTLPTCNRGLL